MDAYFNQRRGKKLQNSGKKNKKGAKRPNLPKGSKPRNPSRANGGGISDVYLSYWLTLCSDCQRSR